MSSGFRAVVTERNTTKLKAYGLAIAVQMVLVPLLLVATSTDATFPSFHPVGAVFGGLLFGASMTDAGGCAAGVWYKVGGGSLDAVVAIGGMLIGAAAFEFGPLLGLRTALQAMGTTTANPTDLGLPLWALTAPIGVVLAVLLLRTRIAIAGDWTWRRTGVLMGLTGALAWPLSILASRGFGMAVVPGTVSMLTRPLGIDYPVALWDLFFVVGIPAGAYLAARSMGPVRVSASPAKTLLRRFAGGLGLGVGASLAAGCTVGHGLTGLPLLAPGSVVVILAIFAGAAARAQTDV